MKPNNSPLYTQSNHPHNILRNIPKSVNNRLFSISSKEEIFNSAQAPYEQALKNSGYNFTLRFTEPNLSENPKPKRQRKITIYHSQKNVRTNIGQDFLKIIDRKCRKRFKEKYYIMLQSEGATLNSRSDLFSTCCLVYMSKNRQRIIILLSPHIHKIFVL